MIQILDCIVLAALALFVVYCIKITRNIKVAIKFHRELEAISKDLQNLIMQSKIDFDKMKELVSNQEAILTSKISEANLLADDMKFLNNRAERVMDTLSRFIKLDNNIKKLILNLENSSKTGIEMQYSKLEREESFGRVLNFVAKKNNTSSSHGNNTIKNMILKISSNYD